MKSLQSPDRLKKNERVFRKHNEKALKGFDELTHIARESGQEELTVGHDKPLHFYCECSDDQCTNRVVLTPRAYEDIHSNRKQFVILHGHETTEVERVVQTTDDYTVVEKFS